MGYWLSSVLSCAKCCVDLVFPPCVVLSSLTKLDFHRIRAEGLQYAFLDLGIFLPTTPIATFCCKGLQIDYIFVVHEQKVLLLNMRKIVQIFKEKP